MQRPRLRAITVTMLLTVATSCTDAAVKNFPAAPVKPTTNTAAETTRPIVSDATDWPLFRGDPAGTGVARCVLPDNLELLWKFTPGDTVFEAGATIVGDTAFVGDGDRAFYAVSLADGKKIWSAPVEQGVLASAAVRDGRVFIGDSSGMFHCFDGATGKELWKYATRAEINSSANFYEDTVLFGSQDGTLYRLRTSDGKLVWKFTITADGGIQSSPTLAGTCVFFSGCDGRLHVIDLASGKETGNLDIGNPTLSSPAVADDIAYFGTEGGNFFAVSRTDLTAELWKYRNPRSGAAYRSSAAVIDPLVIIAGRNKMVQGLRRRDGKSQWSYTTGGRVDSSPVVSGSRVYFGSTDGRLYALKLADGKLAWKYDAGGSFVAAPAVAHDRLVIGNENGTLYCFGAKTTPADIRPGP